MGDGKWVIEFNSGGSSNAGNWASRVSEELKELPQTLSVESKRWEKQSIYRIPHSMKERCRSAYEPETVSIGPYHHGEPRLAATEEHKHRAFLTFLHRSKKPLQDYVDALVPVAEDLKNAYHGLDPKWEKDSEAFLQLMIVDGCFILEIMRAATASWEALSQMGYPHNDPVFSDRASFSFINYIRGDMLKLENQLPRLLLVKLLLVEAGDNLCKEGELTSLILSFIQQQNEENIENYLACPHILDINRKTLVLRRPTLHKKVMYRSWLLSRLPFKKKENPKFMGAMRLNEAGFSFKPSKTSNLNDISFRNGVLKLPVLIVDDMLESNYLNMMAFERFHFGAGLEVSSYVYFMSTIMTNAMDASLLESCGIVYNFLGTHKAVASLFISLSRDLFLDDYELHHVFFELLDYCRSPVLHWLAYAKHNYFTNPWVGISFVAAILLFALTGIQTVYTVMDYYNSG